MPEKFEIYPFIRRFYGDYISPAGMHPLTLCLENPSLLSEINSCLEILTPNFTLKHFIKKSKDNPKKIFDFLSELSIAAYFSTRTNKLEFHPSGKKAKPDLTIYINDLEISCEVKKIEDKFANLPKGMVHIVDDITTVRTAFVKSIKKHQYFDGLPHIFYFDCPGLSEGEICDIFYPIKGPDTSITLDINDRLVNPIIPYNGYFQEKDYSMVSGIACKFFTGWISPKFSEIVYFPNPNAKIKIPEKIIGELGFAVSKQLYNKKNNLKELK